MTRTTCLVDQHRQSRDAGYTCWSCHWDIAYMLDPTNTGDLEKRRPASIPVLFNQLGVVPTTAGGTRGSPGYGSRPPLSVHAAALRDPRSKATTRVLECRHPKCVAAGEHLDHEPGVWHDRDRVAYTEQRAAAGHGPPLHAWQVLAGWMRVLRDERGVRWPNDRDIALLCRPTDTDYIGPQTRDEHRQAQASTVMPPTVSDLAAALLRHVEWLTAQRWIADMEAELRTLAEQLRPADGETRSWPIGPCPNTVDEGEHTRECRAPLRAPLYGDVIHCPACRRAWPREEWETLGWIITSTPRPDEQQHTDAGSPP